MCIPLESQNRSINSISQSTLWDTAKNSDLCGRWGVGRAGDNNGGKMGTIITEQK